jgi:hypothetical protein
MLAIKDLNQQELTKGELLEDKVTDKVKYFNNTQFREGIIIEILPHGSLVIKNKLNFTHDRINKPQLIVNISLMERKLINNLLSTTVKDFNNTKEAELRNEMNLLKKYIYMVSGLFGLSTIYILTKL